MEVESSENFGEFIQRTVSEMWEHLTIVGKSRVRDEKKHLRAEDLNERSDPEAFTKEKILRKVLGFLEITFLPEKHFEWAGKKRKVDWHLTSTKDGRVFFLEAKGLNQDLHKSGAVNQVQEIFKLAEAKEVYEFGIATNGLDWIFVDIEGRVVGEFSLEADSGKIRALLVGEEKVMSPETEEEITKRFYNWYNALLHGGVYKDRKGKRRSISKEDCLVKNIFGITYDEDREAIAQTVVDRLIFIKFLQTKEIINPRVLNHLTKLGEQPLNAALDELFFRVMNRERNQRMNVDVWFKDIPYMNGSLFERTRAEARNSGYQMKADILVEVIAFLDSFSFVHKEGETTGKIDPEILGYIFERAMTASDRKGTGAYYTPKTITRYIAENTIYPFIMDRANAILLEMGYKESELLKDIENLFILPATTLNEILQKVINKITVLDPACGSGAFLLAAAQVLLEVQKRIRGILNLRGREAGIRKVILRNNLYGVDINENAIEIAKLRLWLWLVDSYHPGTIEALPNIEYNIMAGNSLVGFVDISRFRNKPVSLFDFDMVEGDAELVKLLNRREKKLVEYKDAKGAEARRTKRDLEKMEQEIGRMLDFEFHRFLKTEKDFELEPARFKELKSFHWGFEFYDVFHPDKPREMRGFDVVIGNPPYVRQESLNHIVEGLDYKSALAALYKPSSKSFDFSMYFITRSLQITKNEGYHSFIITNKWLRARYGEKMRGYLKESFEIKKVIDFNGIAVFVGVGVDTLAYVVKNKRAEKDNRILYNNPLKLEKMEKGAYYLKQESLKTGVWNFLGEEETEIKKWIEKVGKPLKKWDVKIFYGIKTGYNKAFVIDEKTKEGLIQQDQKNEEMIKPLLRGRDIARFQTNWSGNWLIFIPWHFPLQKDKTIQGASEKATLRFQNDFPSLYNHLLQYKKELSARNKDETGVRYEWYALQRCAATYYEEFEKTKIVYPVIGSEPSFSFDTRGFYHNDKGFHITGKKLEYLLGVLNSRLSFWYLLKVGAFLGKTGFEFRKIYVDQIPIPEVGKEQEQVLSDLTEYLLFLCSTKERKKMFEESIYYLDHVILDCLIYELYFGERIGSNLLFFLAPHIVDIGNYGESEKELAIEQLIETIRAEKRICSEIERIKTYSWVTKIENKK